MLIIVNYLAKQMLIYKQLPAQNAAECVVLSYYCIEKTERVRG